jgi:hypothetical protein
VASVNFNVVYLAIYGYSTLTDFVPEPCSGVNVTADISMGATDGML